MRDWVVNIDKNPSITSLVGTCEMFSNVSNVCRMRITWKADQRTWAAATTVLDVDLGTRDVKLNSKISDSTSSSSDLKTHLSTTRAASTMQRDMLNPQ